MNRTLLESAPMAQPETSSRADGAWDGVLDLPGLLMRLDSNQIALWRSRPSVALYPSTRISPRMLDAITRYERELRRIADWWGIKTFIRDAPMLLE